MSKSEIDRLHTSARPAKSNWHGWYRKSLSYNLLDKQTHTHTHTRLLHSAPTLQTLHPPRGVRSIILSRSRRLILLNFYLTNASKYTKTNTQNTGIQHFMYMLVNCCSTVEWHFHTLDQFALLSAERICRREIKRISKSTDRKMGTALRNVIKNRGGGGAHLKEQYSNITVTI